MLVVASGYIVKNVTRQEPVGKSGACIHSCSQYCVINPSQPFPPLHPLSDSFSLRLLFFFCSIWASPLPFRPQKYDVWCSNDLQTISGNAHHESWKCIFPFPLWRRLHAHREIYTVIAFSFSDSFSLFSLASSLCAVLTVSSVPFIFLSSSFIFPMFLYFMFPGKSQPKSYHVHVINRGEYLKHLDESPWVLLMFPSD